MPSSYYLRQAARNHGWRHQLKKHGKDCVQPWPESNIPELMAKVKANKIQQCSTVMRNMRAHVPNATKATWFTMKFLQKKYEIISSCLASLPSPCLFLDHRRLNHCMIPYFINLKLKECKNVFKCDNRTACYISLVC